MRELPSECLFGLLQVLDIVGRLMSRTVLVGCVMACASPVAGDGTEIPPSFTELVGGNGAGKIFHDAHDFRDVVSHAKHDEIAGWRDEIKGSEIAFLTLASTGFDDIAHGCRKGTGGGFIESTGWGDADGKEGAVKSFFGGIPGDKSHKGLGIARTGGRELKLIACGCHSPSPIWIDCRWSGGVERRNRQGWVKVSRAM